MSENDQIIYITSLHRTGHQRIRSFASKLFHCLEIKCGKIKCILTMSS